MKSAIVAIAAIGLFAVSAAQAFTYDNRTNQNSDGSAKFRDPGDVDGQSIGNSHFSMHFSSSADGQSTGSGLDNRFVPSSNQAFSSPFYNSNNLDTALGNRH